MRVFMNKLTWPDKPTCHKGTNKPLDWVTREDGLRHCSYCEGLHPEDFIFLLENGAYITGLPWKDNWPSEFAVHYKGKVLYWRNPHLLDKMDEMEQALLFEYIHLYSDIEFLLAEDENALKFRPPSQNYQKGF